MSRVEVLSSVENTAHAAGEHNRSSSSRPRNNSTGMAGKGAGGKAPRASQERVWKRAKDPRTGRTYYYDAVTRETQWEKPLELATPEERSAIQEKERVTKEFFAAMEANIVRRVDQGLDVHDVPPRRESTGALTATPEPDSGGRSWGSPHPAPAMRRSSAAAVSLAPADHMRTETPLNIQAPPDYLRGEEAKHKAYPGFWGSDNSLRNGSVSSSAAAGSIEGLARPMRIVRTISHMDDSVLEQLRSTAEEDLSAKEARDVEDMIEESEVGLTFEDLEQAPEPGPRSMKTAPMLRKRPSVMSLFFKTGERPEGAAGRRSGGGGSGEKPRHRSSLRSRGESRVAEPPRMSLEVESAVDGLMRPPLRRNNSTSTIYVNETMAAPDKESTIKVVCCVVRAHMLSAAARDDAHQVDNVPPEFSVFIDRDYVRPQRNRRPSFVRPFGGSAEVEEVEVPKLDTLVKFFRHVYLTAQMEVECIIMSLIYVEKLLKVTKGRLQIRHFNWKSVLFAGMIMASKVWDDLSMWNADFSAVCPSFSLRRINELELTLLSILKFDTTITASNYAKYYFHLRSMCATMGLGGDLREMQPLSIEGAHRLHISSKNFTEMNNLQQTMRERSATLDPRSALEIRLPGDSSVESKLRKNAAKTTQLSLEEVVSMRSPTTGGGSSSTRSRPPSSKSP